MTSPASHSRDELLELLDEKDQQLRELDMALQTKVLLIEQLTQERDEYKLAYDQWMQQRFRNRSERYLDNPDQLRLDLGDTPEAADAAQGLAEAVDEQELTIPEHHFAGCGWLPTRSTQCNLLASVCFVVGPLLDYFKSHVQRDFAVSCDDTSLTLLYPKSMPTFDLQDPKQRRIQEAFEKALCENQPSINAKMWAYRAA